MLNRGIYKMIRLGIFDFRISWACLPFILYHRIRLHFSNHRLTVVYHGDIVTISSCWRKDILISALLPTPSNMTGLLACDRIISVRIWARSVHWKASIRRKCIIAGLARPHLCRFGRTYAMYALLIGRKSAYFSLATTRRPRQ